MGVSGVGHAAFWSPPPATLDLGPDDLHLWLVDLLGSEAEIEQVEQVLAPNEIDCARRFHFERDARRFVLAHGALRSILARYLGLRPADVVFHANAYGKPFLSPNPRASLPDLTFNLSHSGEFALVALARGRRVGVDIEQVRAEFAGGSIAERFFSPLEVRTLAALPGEQQTAAFFRCWTRKEAFVKARGEGLSLPLDSFDVTLLPGDRPALLCVADDPAEAARWSVHAVSIDGTGTYEAALVLEGEPRTIFAFLYRKNC